MMNPKLKATLREYGESLLIAFVLAMIIRTFVVQAFKIPTGSMIPTLLEGDRILVSKFIYNFNEPERGEVVVFKYPENPKLAFIKRLIGKENEKVLLDNGRVFIGGEEITDSRISAHFYYNRGDYGEQGKETLVPDNSLYVLGDNSANSRDSRYWGFVPRKNIIGKALLIYWPPHRIRLID